MTLASDRALVGGHAARSRPRRRRSDGAEVEPRSRPRNYRRLAWRPPSLLDPRHPWPFFLGAHLASGFYCRRGRRARGGAPVRCHRGPEVGPRHTLPLPLAR